jgi:hypothetical protein
MSQITVTIASEDHLHYVQIICDEMSLSAKTRGTGIAKRSTSYIKEKMLEGKAIIAFDQQQVWAGFCYIESWQSGEYVANSGLIISPNFRNQGLAKRIKQKTFELSQKMYPNAKLFGLTTGLTVMNINSELGYSPVTYNQLTSDKQFWEGCKSCVNYAILQDKEYKNCLCTAMLHPGKTHVKKPLESIKKPSSLLVLERLSSIKKALYLTTKKK